LNIIEIKDVTFDYKDADSDKKNYVLKNINLNIKKGEFVVLLGHNGSGKSTLAKLMNGLLMPKSGKIFINEKDTSDEKNIWEIRQEVGMVFQNPDNQIIASIVEEDVAFGLENLGVPSENIRERVDEALNRIGIFDLKDRSPNLLSGGQKQRVAIAGIVAMKPQCIIFDESTSMLDPQGRREVLQTAKDLNKKENITVVMITHYMEEAIEADRVVVINSGEIEMEGTPKEIFKQVDKLKILSLDVPDVTEIAYNLKKEGFNISDDILSIDEMVETIWNYK